MIAIVNIDRDARDSGPHLYEVRINRMPITTFTHNREEPLSRLLLKAAAAVERKEETDLLALVRLFVGEGAIEMP